MAGSDNCERRNPERHADQLHGGPSPLPAPRPPIRPQATQKQTRQTAVCIQTVENQSDCSRVMPRLSW